MNILLAVDGSEHAAWATALLSALPLAKAPTITVLHVVEPLPEVRAMLTPTERHAYSTALREQVAEKRERGHALVKRPLERLRKRWTRVRAVVEEGPAADTILATAKRRKAELIVVGSRGLGHLQRFVMGSVSHRVTTYAPCSVLVVKEPPRHLKNVLMALDGSPYAADAAAFVGAMLARRQIRATAVCVWEFPDRIPVPASAKALVRERCARVMRRAGLADHVEFATGRPANEIARIARRKHAGLVVVGSRGLTGLKRFLLGTVSHEVILQSPASVLVFRR
ncbi:MAG: universal stress protein [Nitrospirota bacterium]